MKRSDMLSDMIDLIESHLVNVDLPENVCSYIGAELLDMIEAKGMEPPLAKFKGTPGGSCLCTMRESCSICGGYCNEWEYEGSKYDPEGEWGE